jgi:lipoate-protein ligase B
MMLLLNYTAYTPFGKLMRVLQAKGFVNKQDRPTVWKVEHIPLYTAYQSNACYWRPN